MVQRFRPCTFAGRNPPGGHRAARRTGPSAPAHRLTVARPAVSANGPCTSPGRDHGSSFPSLRAGPSAVPVAKFPWPERIRAAGAAFIRPFGPHASHGCRGLATMGAPKTRVPPVRRARWRDSSGQAVGPPVRHPEATRITVSAAPAVTSASPGGVAAAFTPTDAPGTAHQLFGEVSDRLTGRRHDGVPTCTCACAGLRSGPMQEDTDPVRGRYASAEWSLTRSPRGTVPRARR